MKLIRREEMGKKELARKKSMKRKKRKVVHVSLKGVYTPLQNKSGIGGK